METPSARAASAALRRRIGLAFAALVIVVGVIGAAAAVLLNVVSDDHRTVLYALADEVSDAEALAIALERRSGAARGYLLTGDKDFLAERDAARGTYDQRLARLAQYVPPSPRLSGIRVLTHQLDVESAAVIALRETTPITASQQWYQRTRPVQVALLAQIEAMIADEQESFAQARDEATALGRTAQRWTIGAAIAAVAIIFLLFAVFLRTARELLRRHAQAQLEEMFHLLEQVPVGVFVVRADGVPFYANHQAEELLGRGLARDTKPGELPEVYSAYEIGTGKVYPMQRSPINRALRGEASEISDIEIRRRDDVIPLHVRGAPVRVQGELAFAIAAFQDVRELRRIATRDALTGLPTRAALVEQFVRERLLAQRVEYPIAVGIIDFDRFKMINDTHGHAIGDEVLRRGAHAISAALRRTDTVGRWGGEELIAVLPKTDVGGAVVALEKALAAMRAEDFHGTGGAVFHATFSAGVVELEDGEELEDAIRRADRELYRAKQAGRNRVFAPEADG